MKKIMIFAFAALLVVAFTVPAMAAGSEWTIYGTAKMRTFVEDVDGPGTATDKDTVWDMDAHNALFGARAKAGAIGGGFEVDMDGGSAPSGNASVRLMYGTWNFGGGTLLVGQHYTPAVTPQSGTAYLDNPMAAYGGQISRIRQPMVQVSAAGFTAAAIQPWVRAAGSYVAGATDTDVTLPKFEASYAFNAGPVMIKGFGAYQTYDEVIADTGYSVTSLIYGVNANAGFGPVYVKAGYYQGTNTHAYGWLNAAQQAPVIGPGVAEDDADDTGWLGLVGFKANDMIGFEGGYGAVTSEVGTTKNEASYWYVQANINLAKGCSITPEVGVMDNDFADAKTTFYGMRWQINF